MLELVCGAFQIDRTAAEPLFYGDPFFDLSHKWLCFADGVAVSTATVVPLRVNMGGWYLHAAGITGVATHPQRQGHGYASRVLSSVLSDVYRMGYQAALLVPKRTRLYERQGFTYVGERWIADYQTPDRSDQAFRWATSQDEQLLRKLHRTHGAHRIGALERDDLRWRYLLWHNPKIALAGDDSYLVIAVQGDRVLAKEVMPPVPKPLPRNVFLGRERFTVIGTREDVFGWEDAGYCVASVPRKEAHFMAKVLDVGSVLALLARQRPSCETVLTIRDPGTDKSVSYRVRNASVEPVGCAGDEMSVQEFTRAVFQGTDAESRTLGLFPRKRSICLYPCDYF